MVNFRVQWIDGGYLLIKNKNEKQGEIKSASSQN